MDNDGNHYFICRTGRCFTVKPCSIDIFGMCFTQKKAHRKPLPIFLIGIKFHIVKNGHLIVNGIVNADLFTMQKEEGLTGSSSGSEK